MLGISKAQHLCVIAGPVQGQKTPDTFPRRLRRFMAAISLIAAVALRGAKEPVHVVESEVIRLDDAKLVQEFSANRKGALDRYVNKIVEIEIDGIEASKTKDSKLKCDLRPTHSSRVLFYEGTFDLKDKLNAALVDNDSKEFPLVVRGQIRAIEQVDPRSNLFEVKLDPAWIRSSPPRGVLSVIKDNPIQVFSLLGSIFLGVTVFRIAWRQDWGWFWGLVLTGIIVGLTCLLWLWGLLGAGAIVGKLYQHYG